MNMAKKIFITLKKLTTTIRVPEGDKAFWIKDGWTVVEEKPAEKRAEA